MVGWEPELPIKSSSDRRIDVLVSSHSLVEVSEPELSIKNSTDRRLGVLISSHSLVEVLDPELSINDLSSTCGVFSERILYQKLIMLLSF